MRIRTLALSFVLMWWVGILSPPFIKKWGGDPSGVYTLYSNVCHQNDKKSFHIFGVKLGVCSRCTGIYTGMLLFVLFASKLPLRLNPPTVVILIIPLVAGKFVEKASGWSSNWERFFTGILPGILLGMGFFYGLKEYKEER